MSAPLFYAHHVHALLPHWPSLGGLPRLDLPTVGSPLGSEHLQHQPRLFWVVVEERQPPCVHVTDLIAGGWPSWRPGWPSSPAPAAGLVGLAARAAAPDPADCC